jgi:hypothetical protein
MLLGSADDLRQPDAAIIGYRFFFPPLALARPVPSAELRNRGCFPRTRCCPRFRSTGDNQVRGADELDCLVQSSARRLAIIAAQLMIAVKTIFHAVSE